MKYILFYMILLFAVPAVGQYDGKVKHWTFDKNESEFSLIKGGVEPTMYSTGIEGMGIFLNGVTDYFIINDGLELTEDFSISFWFHPINAAKSQNLFLHVKENRDTREITRYIQVGVENNQLFFETERGRSSLGTSLGIKNNKWYQLSYVYDGLEMKIYLQGKEIFKTNEVTIFNQIAYHNDIFYIGKDYKKSARFEGVVDEIKTYNRPMKEERAKLLFNDVMGIEERIVIETTPIEPEKEKEKPVVSTEKGIKEDKHHQKEFKNRVNDVQHFFEVNNTNIVVEVWDYDEFDKDRITVTLNNTEFTAATATNILLPKKKDKEVIKFNLDPKQVNYLTFYADDMGQYESQNTAAVRIWDGRSKLGEVIKLVLTEKENAVIKLEHKPVEFTVTTYPTTPEKEEPKEVVVKPTTPEKEIKVEEVNLTTTKPKETTTPDDTSFEVRDLTPKSTAPIEEYVAVLDFAILDPIILNSTEVTLELTEGKRSNKNQKVKILLNEKTIGTPIKVGDKSKKVNFNIGTQKESVLTIEAYLLEKDKKSRVNMRIISEGKQIAAYNLKLEQLNIMIPMIYKKPKGRKPTNERIITVTDTLLTIQVKDNSKVDGDVITINQEGRNILENYKLTEELHDVKVKLTPNQENLFFFVPVSMGAANTENTAWVQILSDGVVIHEFSLKSQSLDKPAKLKILHKPPQTEE